MTTRDERLTAMKEAAKFLNVLAASPYVKTETRDTARAIMRHYPSNIEIHTMMESYEKLFSRESLNDNQTV